MAGMISRRACFLQQFFHKLSMMCGRPATVRQGYRLKITEHDLKIRPAMKLNFLACGSYQIYLFRGFPCLLVKPPFFKFYKNP